MRVEIGYIKDRILCWPETPEDERRIIELCTSANRYYLDEEAYSVDDNLLNRIALNLPVDHLIQSQARDDTVQLGAALRDYQIADLEKVSHHKHWLNANRPGYGKTVEAIEWAKLRGAQSVLVVCPKSVIIQWRTMFKKWWPEFEGKLFVTNYEQLLNRARLDTLKSTRWDVLIVDEIHRLRGLKHKDNRQKPPKMALAVNSLPGIYRIGLTGTPILNRPDDFWGIGYFLNPWFFGKSYWNFVNKYCHIVEDFWGRKPKGLVKNDELVAILEKAIQTFTVRNPDNLVGVGAQESDVHLQMYPKQEKMYRDVKKLAIAELIKADVLVANGMAQLVHLQQITSNTSLFDLGDNPKFDWIKDWLDDNEGEKLVVFSRFRRTILALETFLGVDKVSKIVGGTTTTERAVAQDEFQRDCVKRVMAGTIGAMGESIDGLQHVCNNVVFIDKMWNPEENTQALRRVYRFGQEKFVNVYTLVLDKTVDIKVGRVNLEKLEDIRTLLNSFDEEE